MYIVVKYQINLHSLRNKPEKLNQRLTFLPVSKTRTNKLYIFRQYTYIVYVSSLCLTQKTHLCGCMNC